MAILLTVLKVVGILLLCLVGLLFLILLILLLTRVDVALRFDETGFSLQVGAWGYKYTLLPGKKDEKGEKKEKKGKKPKKKKPKKEEEKPEQKEKKRGGDITKYLKFVSPALDAAKGALRSIFVKMAEVRFTAAKEDDPAGAAMLYGSAWSVAGAVIPQLEKSPNVKKYRFRIDVDFEGTKPLLYLYLLLRAPLWRFFVVGLRFGWKALIIIIKSKLEEKRNRT